MQLEEIDDDTMVQAPLDLDLPARDVLQDDIPPAQELLDHGEDDLSITEENEDPLPVMDKLVQQGDEDDLAITEENEQEEDSNEVHTQELYLADTHLEREHHKPARFKDGYMQ